MKLGSGRNLRRWTKALPLTVGLVLVLLVAACGGDDPTPTPVPPTPTSPAAKAAPAPSTPPTPTPTLRPGETPVPTPTSAPAPTPTPGKAAWEIDWDNTLAAARQEGKLVVTVFRADDRAAVEAFEDAFPGIDVTAQVLGGRDFSARVPAERSAGIFDFDVYLSGATSAIGIIAAGNAAGDEILGDTRSLLIRPDVVDDSNWIGGFDAQWVDLAGKHLFKMIANPGGANIWSNTNLVPSSSLQRFEDLLRPEFKGRICADDPSQPGAGATFFTEVLVTMGEDFLRRVYRETDMIISRDGRGMAESIIRGDVLLCVGPAMTELQLAGIGLHVEQIELENREVSPDLAALIDITCCGVSSGAIEGFYSAGIGGPAVVTKGPNPNAAKIFINWILGPEGARVWFEGHPTDCSPRVDLQDICLADPKLQEGKAYITFHHEKNVAYRKTAQKIAREEFN